MPARGPDQWCAVGHDEGRTGINRIEIGVLLGQHRVMSVGRNEERGPACLDQAADRGDCIGQRPPRQGNAPNPDRIVLRLWHHPKLRPAELALCATKRRDFGDSHTEHSRENGHSAPADKCRAVTPPDPGPFWGRSPESFSLKPECSRSTDSTSTSGRPRRAHSREAPATTRSPSSSPTSPSAIGIIIQPDTSCAHCFAQIGPLIR